MVVTMTDSAAWIAPSLDTFETLAVAAWDALPGPLRRLAGDVVVRIEEYADEATLDELGIDDPLALTGLYTGVDRISQSVTQPAAVIPMVFLYRMPILFEWAERADTPLADLIAHVLIHEVGHHFGLSDADIDALLDTAD